MNAEKSIKHWRQMYDELNTPRLKDKARQEAKVKQRKTERKTDTGL